MVEDNTYTRSTELPPVSAGRTLCLLSSNKHTLELEVAGTVALTHNFVAHAARTQT